MYILFRSTTYHQNNCPYPISLAQWQVLYHVIVQYTLVCTGVIIRVGLKSESDLMTRRCSSLSRYHKAGSTQNH